MAFQQSLADLAYPELIQAIQAYAMKGNFERDQPFMTILYQHLIQHYGTQAQKDNLPMATINEETLLDTIVQIEQDIKQQALQMFNQGILNPAPIGSQCTIA